MNRIAQVLAPLMSAALLLLLGADPAAAADDGKATFLEYKCNKCHSVESQSIEVLIPGDDEEEEEDEWAEEGEEEIDPPDLSNAGNDFENSDEIAAWIQKKLEREGRMHQSKFRGPKKDLQLIANWVLSLRKE